MARKWKDEDRQPLALLRAKAGFSGEKAAALLGVVMMTLYRYERGFSDIPLSIAEKMATLYNVPFDEIRKAAAATQKKKKQKTIQEMMLQRNQIVSPKILLDEALTEDKKWKVSEPNLT